MSRKCSGTRNRSDSQVSDSGSPTSSLSLTVCVPLRKLPADAPHRRLQALLHIKATPSAPASSSLSSSGATAAPAFRRSISQGLRCQLSYRASSVASTFASS